MGLSAIKNRYERLNQRVQQSAVSAGLEIAASACVVLFAGAYFVRYLHAMATTGMYVDELATIANGASLGPIVSMTDYFSENNHIFFNVITSLTLGADPYEPLRARLWSFIAMTATLILVVVFFTRRRRFLEGALVVYGIAASVTLLDLTLLARGYGIVFLCSTSMSLLLLSYLNTRRRRDIALISLAAFIGTWSMPTFLLLAGPMLLLLFLWTRERIVFVCGCLTLAGILLVHIPVFREMAYHLLNYTGARKSRVNDLGTAWGTILSYFLGHFPMPGGGSTKSWLRFLLLVAGAVGPWALWKWKDSEGTALRILSLSTILFYGLAILGKVPDRTTSFGTVPLAVVTFLSLGRVFRYPGIALFRPLVFAGVAVALCLASYRQLMTFEFTPRENWKDAADYIQRNFPGWMKVRGNFRVQHLRLYLDPADARVSRAETWGKQTDDPEMFSTGRLIRVNSNRTLAIPDWETSPEILDIAFAQRRFGQAQVVGVRPPVRPYVVRVLAAGDRDVSAALLDRKLSTVSDVLTTQPPLDEEMTCQFALEPGLRYHSLHLVFDRRQGQGADFSPPGESYVVEVLADEEGDVSEKLVDGDLETSWRSRRQEHIEDVLLIRFGLDPGRYHSMRLLYQHESWPRNFVAYALAGSRRLPIEASDIRLRKTAMEIALGDREIEAVELHVFKEPTRRRVGIFEVWAIRTRELAVPPAQLELSASRVTGGRQEPIDAQNIHVRDEHVVIMLGDAEVERVDFRARLTQAGYGALTEVWAYPSTEPVPPAADR